MERALGRVGLLAITVSLVAMGPLHAQDQTLVGFGPTAGYAIDGSEPFIGGMVRLAPPVNLGPTTPLAFDGSFEYYFDFEGATLFTIAAAAIAQFEIPDSQLRPSAGAGLSLTRLSADPFSDTSIHLQLQAGIMVNIVALDGLVRLGDGSDLILRAAVLFGSLMR